MLDILGDALSRHWLSFINHRRWMPLEAGCNVGPPGRVEDLALGLRILDQVVNELVVYLRLHLLLEIHLLREGRRVEGLPIRVQLGQVIQLVLLV